MTIVSTFIQSTYTSPHTENQNDARSAFLVNGVSFVPPTVPVLLQILSGAKNASQLVPAGSIYGLDLNKSVELTIPAGVIGGPVRAFELLSNIVKLMAITSLISILFICTGTTSTSSVALVARRTISSTPLSGML